MKSAVRQGFFVDFLLLDSMFRSSKLVDDGGDHVRTQSTYNLLFILTELLWKIKVER